VTSFLTSSLVVFEAATCDMGKITKINVYDEIMISNQKRIRKYGNQRNFYINLHLIDGLEMEFTAC